jgi:hypothetical protein
VQRVGFIIIPQFQTMSLATLVYPPNMHSGEPRYEIAVLSKPGGVVASSLGMMIETLPLKRHHDRWWRDRAGRRKPWPDHGVCWRSLARMGPLSAIVYRRYGSLLDGSSEPPSRTPAPLPIGPLNVNSS